MEGRSRATSTAACDDLAVFEAVVAKDPVLAESIATLNRIIQPLCSAVPIFSIARVSGLPPFGVVAAATFPVSDCDPYLLALRELEFVCPKVGDILKVAHKAVAHVRSALQVQPMWDQSLFRRHWDTVTGLLTLSAQALTTRQFCVCGKSTLCGLKEVGGAPEVSCPASEEEDVDNCENENDSEDVDVDADADADSSVVGLVVPGCFEVRVMCAQLQLFTESLFVAWSENSELALLPDSLEERECSAVLEVLRALDKELNRFLGYEDVCLSAVALRCKATSEPRLKKLFVNCILVTRMLAECVWCVRECLFDTVRRLEEQVSVRRQVVWQRRFGLQTLRRARERADDIGDEALKVVRDVCAGIGWQSVLLYKSERRICNEARWLGVRMSSIHIPVVVKCRKIDDARFDVVAVTTFPDAVVDAERCVSSSVLFRESLEDRGCKPDMELRAPEFHIGIFVDQLLEQWARFCPAEMKHALLEADEDGEDDDSSYFEVNESAIWITCPVSRASALA
jgi:hypothetical protein